MNIDNAQNDKAIDVAFTTNSANNLIGYSIERLFAYLDANYRSDNKANSISYDKFLPLDNQQSKFSNPLNQSNDLSHQSNEVSGQLNSKSNQMQLKQSNKIRAKQIFSWIHKHLVDDFNLMTNINQQTRNFLISNCVIECPRMIAEHIAHDGTIKWLLAVDGQNKIEAVFIPEASRGTLCISSQAGCILDCKFCSTGRQGFNRNLSCGEIIAQLWFANKRLKELYPANHTSVNNIDQDHTTQNNMIQKITNVVMMGMGEPLANYNNVVEAIQIMLDNSAYNLSRHKVTISTSGLVPNIYRLASECNVALAISLHASNDTVRSSIMPVNIKYPLNELMAACREYIRISKCPRIITFEYVMLDGVNDHDEHAKELIKLTHGIKCKFNLIPFNPFPNTTFRSSDMNRILQFQAIIRKYGYIATVRKTRGDDINAACGQLAGNILNRKKYNILIRNKTSTN